MKVNFKLIKAQEIAVAGYYWWLPSCFDLKSAKPEEWQITLWHPNVISRPKSGWCIGPRVNPFFEEVE